MNYILRHTGSGQPDTQNMTRVLEANDITILDHSNLPKMALVNGITDHQLPNVKKLLPEGWELFPQQESVYRVPDTRRQTIQKTKK